MRDAVCGLAAETKVETPEGAMAIRTVVGKAIAVFTREEGGRTRFRMMRNVRKVAEQQPVLTITLESGQSFRVAPEQVLFKKGMVECRADALRAGDHLEPSFAYPEGYRFTDEVDGGERQSTASLRVVNIKAGGSADIYTLGVNRTGCFFLTVGVLCKAEKLPAA
ncbi:MAG: hypothetical protein ACE5I7_05530 [Candidatus Binatia bacterium]